MAMVAYAPSVTHYVFFTDADPVRAGINAAGSASPQMNFLVGELMRVVGTRQVLALHVPGVTNTRADMLSRTDRQTVLQELEQASFTVRYDRVEFGPVCSLARQASEFPQRTA